jgi:hypothetical protein
MSDWRMEFVFVGHHFACLSFYYETLYLLLKIKVVGVNLRNVPTNSVTVTNHQKREVFFLLRKNPFSNPSQM